jgi:hypothetical protein
MTPPRKTSPARFDGDPTTQYAAIVWKGGHAENIRKHWFDSPVDALSCAVEYLKQGYQARLSDGAVAHFAELERPPVGPDSVPVPKFAAGGT